MASYLLIRTADYHRLRQLADQLKNDSELEELMRFKARLRDRMREMGGGSSSSSSSEEMSKYAVEQLLDLVRHLRRYVQNLLKVDLLAETGASKLADDPDPPDRADDDDDDTTVANQRFWIEFNNKGNQQLNLPTFRGGQKKPK